MVKYVKGYYSETSKKCFDTFEEAQKDEKDWLRRKNFYILLEKYYGPQMTEIELTMNIIILEWEKIKEIMEK